MVSLITLHLLALERYSTMYLYHKFENRNQNRHLFFLFFFPFFLHVLFIVLGCCLAQPSFYTSPYLPAQFLLAEAVPGSEEDQPCTSCSPIYMSIPGLYAVQDGGTTN